MTTFDLDVVFEPGAANRARLLAALADLDAVYWDPAGRRLSPTDERLQGQRLHLLETRFGRLDLLREIGHGQGWAEVRARSHAVELAGLAARVLGLDAVNESRRRLTVRRTAPPCPSCVRASPAARTRRRLIAHGVADQSGGCRP